MKRSRGGVEFDVQRNFGVRGRCLDVGNAINVGYASGLHTIDCFDIVTEGQRIARHTVGDAKGLSVNFLNGERHRRDERYGV